MKNHKKIFKKVLINSLFEAPAPAPAPAPALAETIHVKYRGPVNPENFQCAHTSSSFVHSALISYPSFTTYLFGPSWQN